MTEPLSVPGALGAVVSAGGVGGGVGGGVEPGSVTCTVAPAAFTVVVETVMPSTESANDWPARSGASVNVAVIGFVSMRYERLITEVSGASRTVTPFTAGSDRVKVSKYEPYGR